MDGWKLPTDDIVSMDIRPPMSFPQEMSLVVTYPEVRTAVKVPSLDENAENTPNPPRILLGGSLRSRESCKLDGVRSQHHPQRVRRYLGKLQH